MSWIDKPWGRTREVLRASVCHVDEIEAMQGGYCSIHAHTAKANVFHVVTGLLYVRQFTIQGERLKCQHIAAGETLVVVAGIWHQFWARQVTRAMEVYLPTVGDCDADDIERHPGMAVGGIEYDYGTMEAFWAAAFRGQVCTTK